MTKLNFSAKTDKGAVRSVNQDNCYAASLNESTCFAVVCDGMGGAKAGDVASADAIKVISEKITSGWNENLDVNAIKDLIYASVDSANGLVYSKAESSPDFAGMGTTVVIAYISGNKVLIAHAGDSRAYIFSDKKEFVTKDHSWVQEMVDSGMITADEAENHPSKNYITRALGVDSRIILDFSEKELADGEKILLCSDGLTNEVSEADIAKTVFSLPPAEAVEVLINTANENGGADNITAVVISR